MAKLTLDKGQPKIKIANIAEYLSTSIKEHERHQMFMHSFNEHRISSIVMIS